MGRAYGTPIKTLDDLQLVEWEALRHTIPGDYLFRVEAVSYAAIAPYADPISGEGEWYSTAPRLELFALPVLRWTPCGATLYEMSGARNRWVSLDPHAKQYASRTAAEAVEQFAERRRRQIYILKRQLARAERELALSQPCSALVAPIPA